MGAFSRGVQINMTDPHRKKATSELRQDLVSGDWVVVAPKRALRHGRKLTFKKRKIKLPPKSTCPFEDLQKSGHGVPILALDRKSNEIKWQLGENYDWFLQVVPNKYPIVREGDCSVYHREGPFSWLEGAGFHEIVIFREHAKQPAYFSRSEVDLMLQAYQKRYQALSQEDCAEYVLIYHNHGPEAGATIYHPHSQIVALPVIPPDVGRSIRGSGEYFKKYQRCVHCDMIAWERKEGSRVVYENETMIAFCPYASKVSFETRIFPKMHENAIEAISVRERWLLADALMAVLRKVAKGLADPPYNFFIHTAPTHPKQFRHYHWHIEILPRTSIWAGVELGTGVEVVSVTPEQAAMHLRSAKI